MKSGREKTYTVFLVINSIYWLWFWVYFLTHSIPQQPPVVAMEVPRPYFVVLGRETTMPEPEILRTPWIKSALWLNLPSVLITLLLPMVIRDGTATFLGTNLSGLRLILVTFLSYGQWYVVAKLMSILITKVTNRAGSPPAET